MWVRAASAADHWHCLSSESPEAMLGVHPPVRGWLLDRELDEPAAQRQVTLPDCSKRTCRIKHAVKQKLDQEGVEFAWLALLGILASSVSFV